MISLRNNLVLIILFFLLLLNYGFMQVRVVLPLAELLLLWFLISTSLLIVLKRMATVFPVFFYLAWVVYAVMMALFDSLNYGLWALRDASNAIESLFVLVGFSIFISSEVRERFFRGVPVFFYVVLGYSLFYPFAAELRSFSPYVIAPAGYPSAIFFNYVNTSILLLVCSVFMFLYPHEHRFLQRFGSAIGGFIIVFTVVFFQARTVYVQLAFLLILFAIIRPSVYRWVYFAVALSIFVFAFLSSIGVSVVGRLGEEISLVFLKNHFLAIFGIEAEGVVGAAKGVFQRIDWWGNVIDKWTSSYSSFLFGVGFGIPLTDFVLGNGALVREPHNSYLSIFARTGLIGGALWVVFQLFLYYSWLKAYIKARKMGALKLEVVLLLFFVYFVLILILAMGEDGFEKPYNTMPYYLLFGIVLRVNWLFNNKINWLGKDYI